MGNRPGHGRGGRVGLRRRYFRGCGFPFDIRRSPSGNRFPVRLLRFRRPGSLQRLRREPARIEAEIGGLLLPDTPEFRPVDIAFSCPGHQRRALGEALVLRRCKMAAGVHRRLDLGAPGRERLDYRASDAGDLEAAVCMGLQGAVAEPCEPARQLAPVERAEQHLGAIELLVGHGPPLAVLALHHVGEHRVRGEAAGRDCARCRGGRWRRRCSGFRRGSSPRSPDPSVGFRRHSSRSSRAPPPPPGRERRPRAHRHRSAPSARPIWGPRR